MLCTLRVVDVQTLQHLDEGLGHESVQTDRADLVEVTTGVRVTEEDAGLQRGHFQCFVVWNWRRTETPVYENAH